MMRLLVILQAIVVIGVCSGCGTTDSALRDSGRSESYVQGFHDGRHSGMREAGNNFEHYIKDEDRFAADPEYKAGWLAGEVEGKELQAQATAVGRAAAGGYGAAGGKSSSETLPDYDQIAKDAVKDVDTSAIKSLEND
jgi:hypothetical protein